MKAFTRSLLLAVSLMSLAGCSKKAPYESRFVREEVTRLPQFFSYPMDLHVFGSDNYFYLARAQERPRATGYYEIGIGSISAKWQYIVKEVRPQNQDAAGVMAAAISNVQGHSFVMAREKESSERRSLI